MLHVRPVLELSRLLRFPDEIPLGFSYHSSYQVVPISITHPLWSRRRLREVPIDLRLSKSQSVVHSVPLHRRRSRVMLKE
jgi:hypothetical protein